MNVDQFDFTLPEANIALRPAEPRGNSRLLVVQPGEQAQDRQFSDLLDFLRPGDGLVFNDTRVIPAQFTGVRVRNGVSAQISVTLHRRLDGHIWVAFAKGAKKVKIGETISFGNPDRGCLEGVLDAVVSAKGEGGEIELTFELSGPALDTAMMGIGQMPLPPYIASKRQQDSRDLVDYQTVYAENDGAVAAPTAGLHFDAEMLNRLNEMGVSQHYVTLHVGAGTFLPVKAEDTVDHKMHFENGFVDCATAEELNGIRQRGGRIVSVGTTSLRLLESAIDDDGNFEMWQGATDIFITPGYKFKAVDLLITNFHLPRSTLFMLVSAFSGMKQMQNAYTHAIDNDYRFYSYGDSSLLFPDGALDD